MTDEQIIEYLGLSDAPVEGHAALVKTVRDGVDARVGAILSEALTEEQYDQFAELQKAGDEQAIWDWLAQVLGADTSELYEVTLLDYLNAMKGAA